ncbi:MAG: type II toxin-antitoxin system VapC family toxin [Lachnospiraceae bacterium]|nr:type II toxin-antitoxin system VapC family toxin [Lachnospiraceae bacterium]
MKYLLDTHAIIWLIEDSPKMPAKVKDICRDPNNQIFISSISLWEIAIKMSLDKLSLNIELYELLSIIQNSDIVVLQIKDDYLEKILSLPFVHKDPFDRLIIATAITENMTIITIDDDIQKYDVYWVW